jgi:hypothetical protein
MTRNVGTSVENNFTRGLITEVTGVNSPENSVLQTLNIEYGRTGKAAKRRGFDFELDNVRNDVSEPGVRLEYLWQTVSDNNEKNFVVTQVGATVYFYEASGEGPLSSLLQPFEIDLLSFKIPVFSDSQVSGNFCSFSSGKGYLFIAHPNCSTIYVEYDLATNSISVKSIDLTIRDFEGVEDDIAVDFRPAVSTNAHVYNLFNQGWYATAQFAGVESVAIQNVYGSWVTNRSDEPANSDVWWYYTTVNQGGATSGQEAFNPSTVDSRAGLYGNTPAPRGHYIINPFQTNRSALSGISGIQENSSDGYRPSVVSFYAGRAFYAGVGKSGYSSTIYFSQIIEDDAQLGKCYQRNDPTSREVFDLLDSDGGTIKIQDINNILDLKVVGQSLIVFASNGVWSISGSDNSPFRATDYTVSKLSAFPAISKTTIVDVSGTPVWWNYEGVFILKNSELGLTNEITSLTTSTIQKFFDEIPAVSKLYAKGSSNDQMKMVYWIYSTDSQNPTQYDRILVLDSITGAFYVFSIPESGDDIVGIVSVRSVSKNSFEDNVVTEASDNVITESSDIVFVDVINGYLVDDKVFKFLTDDGTDMSFAEIRSESYLDWGLYDYESSFLTGYRIRGELLRKSQTNYLTVLSEDIENSSCYVQPVWDYAYDHDSGRFGNPQQIYRNRSFRDYQRSRIKIRGNGYSLQFKFYGLSGQPFVIVGWFGYESTTGAP